MLRRAAVVFGAMLALRVVVRASFLVVTVRHIEVLAIVDAATLLLTAPWVASGRPRPTSIARRAAGTVGMLLAGAVLANLALFATDNDSTAVLGAGVPAAVLAGPLGGALLFLLATGVAWGWLAVRGEPARGGKLAATPRKERVREDQPNRNVPRPPGAPQLRVRKGPHR